MISVIIPTYNEEEHILRTLRDLHRPEVAGGIDFEVIISDAGSSDATLERVREFAAGPDAKPISILSSPRGRGAQMNRAAESARQPVLLFLHADISLPHGAFQGIAAKLNQDSRTVGGAFLKRYRERSPRFWINILLSWIKTVIFKSFWGNEGIFVLKRTFDEMNGYREWPLLEDVDFSHRMRRQGRVAVVHKAVVASARRYLAKGVIDQGSRNIKILIFYWLGRDPRKLAKWY